MKQLKKYVSLFDQAEQQDNLEALKELIDTIREMTHHELYYLLCDTEVALKVLCRGEAKGDDQGAIREIVKRILELATLYLEKSELKLHYTYELIEKRRGE